MKTSITIFVTLLLFLTILNGELLAQDIEATLNTDDDTSGFVVKNNSGDSLLIIKGDGDISMTGCRLGSNISLFANSALASIGQSAGGNINLSAGDFIHDGWGEIAYGGQIDINGGENGPYVGGDINIKGGDSDGNGGNVLIEAGYGMDAGDIKLISGWGRSGGQSGDIILQTGNQSSSIGGRITFQSLDGITLDPDWGQNGNGRIVEIIGSGTYSGSWTHTSDIRFKKNIQTLDESLKKIMALRGVLFDWRNDEFPNNNFEKNQQIGVIAQEVEKVLPEIVKTDKDGIKSVDYSKLSVVLIEATKEQQKKIVSLEERIEILEKLLLNDDKSIEQVKVESNKKNKRVEL